MTPPFSGINHNIYYLTVSVGQEPGYAELSGSDPKFSLEFAVKLTARTVVLSEGSPGEGEGNRSADLFLRSLERSRSFTTRAWLPHDMAASFPRTSIPRKIKRELRWK